METCSTDFYEKQLLSVFESYDVDHRGSLDRDGLMQLCNNLQLEDQGLDLMKCLLSDAKKYVTFSEFKDGLLSLLRQKAEYISSSSTSRPKSEYITSDNESDTSDREVLPKFVYGSKKYGRRSKPERDELKTEELYVDKYEENKPLKQCNKVQRSNSQNDVTHSKKRKTNITLKRCTSFPGNHEMEKQYLKEKENVSNLKCQMSTLEYNENILRALIDHLDFSKDGYLSHMELKSVYEFLGLQKLTKGVFYQLINKAEVNKRVTIDELLEAFRKEECWYDTSQPAGTITEGCIAEDSLLFPSNKTLQFITLGPDGSGTVSAQTLVEMWEGAGVTSAASLLQDLGFSESLISVCDLATVLEDELRNLNDSRGNVSVGSMGPHIALLQASIALYQSELKYLRTVLEQLSAERDKLRLDIADANHRASLLAQEVDDNHAKMEKSTQNQVRLLEQRHSDLLKERTLQFTSEKEQISQLNGKLEQRVLRLEAEEGKLRTELAELQRYNCSLEKENSILTTQLSEMEQIHNSLTEKVGLLEAECQKMSDMDRERDQLERLLEKLSLLQRENAQLRDKNDELCSEVETLSSQCKVSGAPASGAAPAPPAPVDGSVLLGCEAVGLGAIKRRVHSPTKDPDFGLELESPRLGKVRRCYNKSQQLGEVLQDALDVLPAAGAADAGFEPDLDCGDYSSFADSEDGNDEIFRLNARIKHLEQLIQERQHDSVTNANPSGFNSLENESSSQLTKRIKDLELILNEVQRNISNMIHEKPSCKEECGLKSSISQLSDRLQNITIEKEPSDEPFNSTVTVEASVDVKVDKCDCSTETDQSLFDDNNKNEQLTKDNEELKEECDNLREALQLLGLEIENCENYWSNKLDEERRLFEQEQKQNSEKLNELLDKMSEYEEQFDSCSTKNRLPPIEEVGIEQQFTDLEDEFKDYKLETDNKLKLKDRQISNLQRQLDELQFKKSSCNKETQVNLCDVAVKDSGLWQTPDSSNCPAQSDSIDSTILNSHIPERDYINPVYIWNKENTPNVPEVSIVDDSTHGDNPSCSSLPPNLSWQPTVINTSPQPHSICNIPTNQQNTGSARVKRTRKHDRNILTSQARPQKKEHDLSGSEHAGHFQNAWNASNYCNDGYCPVRLTSLRNLYSRLYELDKHCKTLQTKLKTQQRYSENMLHQYWQQHVEETNESRLTIKFLQEKLTRSDMLIKDLYIETSYLKANNERLEHRCHMLVQSNSESTSV